MLRKSFGKVLAVMLVLCLSLGCCAFAMEGEAALQECFPQEVVAVDGVEYNFFAIELEVCAGDSVRCERCGFRCEGDEWILTRLEVAE